MATLVTDIQMNDVVSMVLYGTINGSNTITGTVVAILSASGLPPGNDAGVNHTNLYRDLPQSVKAVVADDYTTYLYLGIRLADGTIQYIGMPWVIAGSINLTILRTATLTISDFRDQDTSLITTLLKANGYTVSHAVIV